MGVYIKGLEMPKSCWDCEVGGAKQMDNATCPFYSMEYQEQENYQDKIAEGCPLVPVPSHGRCIDADAFIKDECNNCDGACEALPCDCLNCEADCRCDFMKDIAEAPTIIPASCENPAKSRDNHEIDEAEDAAVTDLKPCPFCGSEWTQVRWIGFKNAPPSGFVAGYRGECSDCGATTRAFNSPDDAAVAWNWRVSK